MDKQFSLKKLDLKVEKFHNDDTTLRKIVDLVQRASVRVKIKGAVNEKNETST